MTLSHATGQEISIVIPAKDEAEQIALVLGRILAAVRSPCEVLVVVDSADDPTRVVVLASATRDPRLRCLVSSYGPGPANAIRFGIDQARAAVVGVTMADACDDVRQIDCLAGLARAGAVGPAPTRHAPGGGPVRGP